jgi:hypothetical protein
MFAKGAVRVLEDLPAFSTAYGKMAHTLRSLKNLSSQETQR